VWAAGKSTGARARVDSVTTSRKAAMASSSRAVPLSRSPSLASAFPRFAWVTAHWSGARAGIFLQGFAIGGDGLLEPRRPALPRAERFERIAEIVLGPG